VAVSINPFQRIQSAMLHGRSIHELHQRCLRLWPACSIGEMAIPAIEHTARNARVYRPIQRWSLTATATAFDCTSPSTEAWGSVSAWSC
jgi:hypothetical protein